MDHGTLKRDHVWGPHGDYVDRVLVLPEIYRAAVFQRAHLTDTEAHLPWQPMLEQVQRQVYWPLIKEDIQQWIQGCEWCRAADLQPSLSGESRTRQSTPTAPKDFSVRCHVQQEVQRKDLQSSSDGSQDGSSYLFRVARFDA